jgi:hypothetical protein
MYLQIGNSILQKDKNYSESFLGEADEKGFRNGRTTWHSLK